MTPAALVALLSGNAENFRAASTPGGIEAQERAGQVEQSFAETLPVEMMGCTREDFTTLGFEFTEGSTDPLFVNARFPKGWRKQATEHAMWSRLLDDKGRERGMIFYKAAFYDRSAHVNLLTRYQVKRQQPYESDTLQAVDTSTGEVLQSFKFVEGDKWGSHANVVANNWFSERFPNWKSPVAYWEGGDK